MSTANSRRRTAGALGLVALLGGACAVGPTFRVPSAPASMHYTGASDPAATGSADGIDQHFSPGATVAGDWWRLFGSRELDEVVGEALRGNAGLDAARATLHASEDSLRSGYGIFFPAVDAGTSAVRQRTSPAAADNRFPGAVFNLFTLSASVSYALDVFGGQRRLIENLHAQVDVARAKERAAYVALTANVVNTVIAHAAYRAQLVATRQWVRLQQEQLRVAAIQAQTGLLPYAGVLALRSQLAGVEAELPTLQRKLDQSDNLLAVLCGHPPGEWRAPVVEFENLTLPQELPVSLPSDLVRQRPDVLAAEGTAHAASAAVGIATAAMLPSVTLNASLGDATNSADSLFPGAGRYWSAGAAATAPIFEGGTLRFRRRTAQANYQAAMALYRQTVLAAFEQVADALQALEHDSAAVAAEARAFDASDQSVRLAQANFTAGLASYDDLLVADALRRQSEIARIAAQAARYQDTVALFAALGGGWWNGAAPGP
jgi:NodT family efflux transporter outer membrane factor (OMF) lipoprotein